MTALRLHTPTSSPVRFALHYGEMVLVMLLGMFVLGELAALALPVVGLDAPTFSGEPAEALSLMAFNMTVPMVAWMRHRGHGWAASAEMAASMIVPTLVALALLAAGTVDDGHALMGIQHALMFPAMLAVMLLRRDEYSH